MSQNSKLLREDLRKKLSNISPLIHENASSKITQKVISHKVFIESQRIACYAPMPHEIDTWAIIKEIWRQKKHCYLPVLLPKENSPIGFVKVLPSDPLFPSSKFKILEPKIDMKKIVALADLDLVIVPLLGYNELKFRLGQGAGYYDRTFTFKNNQSEFAKPYLLGVGFKCQKIEYDPNPWDVPMDEIITE